MTYLQSAVKFNLFADEVRKRKIEALGDPLQIISRHIDFTHLAGFIDELFPRKATSKGGRPPYLTEVMVRMLVLKYLNNHSDKQMESQLLNRMSYQRFCLLEGSANVPDRNTIRHYQQRLGVNGTTALFQAVDSQLLRHGHIARCGQIIDVTLVSAPIQHFTKAEKAQLDQGQIPEGWSAAKRHQKDLDATHTKKHGKSYHGYKTRAHVEHPFAQMRHMGGKIILTIGQVRATAAMTMKAACYNIKRLARFLADGVDAFYKASPSKTRLRLQVGNP